jgi:two-component system sensor histidine kinase UhpB
MERHFTANSQPDITFQAGRVTSGESFPAFSLRSLRLFLICVSVGLGYYLGSRIGFFLTPRGSPIATYWPPNAILLASFLLFTPRLWWALILSVLGAHLLVQVPIGVPLPTALGWFLTNAGEALFAAAILYRFNRRKFPFNSVQRTLFFLIFGVFLAPFVTSFFDAAVVIITHWGANYWMLWMTRLFSNMLAVLTVVPAVVAFGTGGIEWWRKAALARRFEALLLPMLLIAVTMLVYGRRSLSPSSIPALVCAPLPLLLWASLRFGAGYLAASVGTVALISFHFVIQGRGPFAVVPIIENVLFLQLLLGIVAAILLLLNAVLAERQRTEHELRASRARQVDAEEHERRRIARELHDDIGQQLALVELELSRLRASVEGPESPSSMGFSLEKLKGQVAAISEATRGLSHGLHPAQLEYLGLVPALKSFCTEIQHKASMEISLREKNPLQHLDWEVSLCLFRVAQQALHNVVKHSHARSASVELSADEHRVLMRIIDNGVGFVPERERPAGLGLVNMRERLKSVGGTLKISSDLRRGTIVQASVPLNQRPGA